MAGQVKHAKIFSSIRPDWRLVKLLASLEAKEHRGPDRRAWRRFLPMKASGWRIPRSAQAAARAARAYLPSASQHPTRSAISPMAGGSPTRWRAWMSAKASPFANGACVAVEAMEGTDAMLRARRVACERQTAAPGERSRGGADICCSMCRWPGLEPSKPCAKTGATALAVDAGRTLLLDREDMLKRANERGIAIIGYEDEQKS